MELVAVVAVCTALVVYQALRRPMLRRLAARGAARRPGETALVIAGSLLGTALITGSLIVGDTLDASINATAYTQLGPVDEMVTASDQGRARAIVRAVEDRDHPLIDGVLPMVSAESAFASNASGNRLAEPDGRIIEVDFDKARGFGGDPAATGITGPTPSTGEIVITEDLAEALDARGEDAVNAFLYGKKVRFTVVRVLPRLGLAGFWTGFESTSPNAFAMPGTLEDLVVGQPPRRALPPSHLVLVSNRGDVESGARLTTEVSNIIEDAFPRGSALRVEPLKRDKLDAAEEQGEEFGELFLGIGSFAVIAGILLLVNVFVMLAEERKSELGMLRAVGMKRLHLIRAFVIEGTFYSLTASVLGAAAGIAVGWAIVKLAAPIFGGFGDFSLDLAFDFTFESIVAGFSAGALISLATILFTSVRISRINIIRAIRDVPEPRAHQARLRTVIGGVAVAAVALGAFLASLGDKDAWATAVLGPPIAAFALLPLVSRVIPRRIAVLIVAAGGLVWGIFGDAILDGQFFESGEIFAFVLQGILLTFSAVVLLTQSQETFESGIRRVAATRLPLRLSIAYPLARRFRTGLTLGMFALVIFTMTFIAALANIFGGQVETALRKEGRFQILMTASATNPPGVSEISSHEGVVEVASLTTGPVLYQPKTFIAPEPWSAAGIDEAFVRGGPPQLFERAEGLESDRDAWQRLLTDRSAIIVPQFFLQTGGGPPAGVVRVGEEVAAIDPITGKQVRREVVGFVDNDFAFSGSYMSKRSLRELLGARAAPSRFFIKVDGSASDARAVARDLQGDLVGNGVEARTFRSIVEQFQRVNLQFLNLMQAYLALGLLVGIAGLGVVMVRAVRERRRDVGVLRSLGFLVGQVRRSFVFESGFVALEGILIGTVLALVTAAQLVSTGSFGEDLLFEIPWLDVGILTLASLGAAVLATAWPAQQASRIPPAAALRIAE